MKNGKDKIKFAYIAGPYSAPTVDEIDANIYTAWEASIEVANKGWFPICPHQNTAKFDRFCDQPYEFYIEGDLELIRRIQPDAMVMVGDYMSSQGAVIEMALARDLGIRIFTSVVDLPDISDSGFESEDWGVYLEN